MKGKSKAGKEIPKSLDYFNIDPFEELIGVYGSKPDKLLIYCPASTIEDFFYTEYNAYGGGDKAIKKRQCDGETCLHRVDESVVGQSYQAGEETDCICKDLPDDSKDRCKSYTGLKVFIADPKSGKIISPIPFYFETRSDNSSDNIYSELEKTWNFTGGRLIGIPFVLSVKMVDGLRNGAKTKFPIWSLQAVGTVEKQLSLAQVGMIPTTNELALPVNISEESRMIEAPEERPEDDKQPEPEDTPDPWETDPKSPYYKYLEWMKKRKSQIIDITESDKLYYDVLKEFKLSKSSYVDKNNIDLMNKVTNKMQSVLDEIKPQKELQETLELTKPE